MVADQLPQLGRVVEFELDGEQHDARRHAFAAMQSRKILSVVTSVNCSRCTSAASAARSSRENM